MNGCCCLHRTWAGDRCVRRRILTEQNLSGNQGTDRWRWVEWAGKILLFRLGRIIFRLDWVIGDGAPDGGNSDPHVPIQSGYMAEGFQSICVSSECVSEFGAVSPVRTQSKCFYFLLSTDGRPFDCVRVKIFRETKLTEEPSGKRKSKTVFESDLSRGSVGVGFHFVNRAVYLWMKNGRSRRVLLNVLTER